MVRYESGTVVDLTAREAITLPDVRGATLRVTQGTVWLTQEHDHKDVVLRKGDNWVVEKDGATVVEAQDNATFCIVGREATTLRFSAQARRSTRLWSALVSVLTPPPRHVTPYA